MSNQRVPVRQVATSEAQPRHISRTSAKAVAEQFQNQYYTVFSNYIRYLYRFYDRGSSQSISELQEDGTITQDVADNQESIHELVMRLFPEAKAEVESVLSQYSHGGGIIVQVTGTLHRKSSRDANFSQSFFLAVQEKGFFVLNDILHIIPKSTRRPVSDQFVQTFRNNEAVPQPITPRDYSQPIQQNQSMNHHIDTILNEAMHSHNGNKHSMHGNRANGLIQQQQQQYADSPRGTYGDLIKRNQTNGIIAAGGGSGGNKLINPLRVSTGNMNSPHQMTPHEYGNNTPLSPSQHPAIGGYAMHSRMVMGTNGMGMGQRSPAVFVRDIPPSVDEQSLKQTFEAYGAVTSVMIRNGRRDSSRFAFVDFADVEGMERALKSEVVVMGRQLQIEEKKPIVLRNKQRTNRRSMEGSPGSQDATGTGNASTGGPIHFF